MITYSEFFSITLEHGYYDDLSCSELSVSPSQATQVFLNSRGLIVKNCSNGLQVIAPFNKDGRPDVDPQEAFVLAFTVRLEHSDFTLFTDLDSIGDGTPYRIVNVPTHNRLQPAKGFSKFVEANAFATIEIDSQHLLSEAHWKPLHYRYRFNAIKLLWCYYLVTNDQGNTFSIEHDLEDGGATIQFTKKQLDPIANREDAVLQSLVKQYPGTDNRYYCFTSKEPVAYHREGIGGIHLKKEGTVVRPDLPNPRFTDNGIQIIDMVQLGKANSQTEAIDCCKHCTETRASHLWTKSIDIGHNKGHLDKQNLPLG